MSKVRAAADLYPLSIDRDKITAFVRELGIDPGTIRALSIDLHKVTVEFVRRDEDGQRFSAGDVVATSTVLIPIKPAKLARRHECLACVEDDRRAS